MRTENPRLVQEHQLDNAEITLYRTIHAKMFLDPYYFGNETVRGADYDELLDTYLKSSRHYFPQTICSNWVKHPPYSSNGVRPLLVSLFPYPWIGKHGPYNWPARSPDLSLPVFSQGDFLRKKYLGLLCAI